MTSGLVGLATGLAIMSRLDDTSSYGHFLGGLAAFGLGMALTSTPSTTAIVTSLPRAKQGVASAVNDVSREIGSALGIAILGSLFNRGYRSAVGPATTALPAEAAHAVEESAGAGLAVASHMGPSGQPVADTVSHAFVAGLHDAMIAGVVIALLAAAFTVWRAPGRTSGPQERVADVGSEVDSDVEPQEIAA
jgi:fucose permease